MKTKILCQQIVDLGIPIAFIARKINRDATTINHWLKGHSNLAPNTEENLYQVLKEIRQSFINLEI